MVLDTERIRAVVFDMDDTLLGWKAAETQAIDSLAQLLLRTRHVAVARTRGRYADVMQENIRSFRATGKWWFVQDRLRLLAGHLDLPEEDVPGMTEAFLTTIRSSLQELPGAREALAAARTFGKTALLTNGHSDVQRPKVERFRLHEQVDFVGISGELGHWKPDLQAFRVVLERLGAAPHEALMVGDSIPFDLEPAKELGMQTCLVDPARHDHAAADAVAATPGDVAKLLQ